MEIRPATPDDTEMLAQLHVQAWEEAYRGHLPDAEIAARDLPYRRDQWERILRHGKGRVLVSHGRGFAHFGSQRDDALRAAGYPEELYSFYTLKQAYGTGLAQALLTAGRSGLPFTALVLDTNARACRFYEKAGGRHLETRQETLGAFPFQERAYGWASRAD